MKQQSQYQVSAKSFVYLAGGLLLLLGLMFALSVQSVAASPSAQDYPVDTATPTEEVTQGPTATVGTVTPTVTVTVTPTGGTMPPPAVTGTPTQLVPVTGADLSQPGGPSLGVWAALWLLGLVLVAFGLRSKLDQKQ